MTQLFIDGQEAVLSEKFSCKQVSENPFFTKSGDYTLNITLSLLNPINAKIYKHINRLNSLSRFNKRTAILVADGVVIIKGLEVVLKHSNEQIEIQIVAGNSSLNYLIGNQLQLRDLDLGRAVINKSAIVNDLNYTYPDRDWLLLPFFDPDKKFIGNRYTYKNSADGSKMLLDYAYNGEPLSLLGFYKEKFFNLSEWFVAYENYRPQPFFCFIIKKVIQTLGYTLTLNEIESHTFYKIAYIVHAQDTLNFAKMLPNWTVEKFFSEIESLFDCTLLVDNHTMTASIIFNHKYYESATEYHFTALDDFDAEIEENPDDKMIYAQNLAYNLPSSTYYDYQNLPFSVDQFGVMPVVAATDKAVIGQISNNMMNLSEDDRRKAYHRFWASDSLYFIDKKIGGRTCPYAVNDYRMLKNSDNDSAERSFDIIPAEMGVLTYFLRLRFDINFDSWFDLQMPIARCEEEPDMTIKKDNQNYYPRVEDYIEGDAEQPEKREEAPSYSQLTLAFYNANKWAHREGKNPGKAFDGMPVSFVRSISEHILVSTRDFVYFYQHAGKYVNPLNLFFLHNELYRKNKRIDKTKTYTIRFLAERKKLDPKALFIINNKKFYCKKLETEISAEGIHEIVSGEFFSESE